jgi:hypothetical protein
MPYFENLGLWPGLEVATGADDYGSLQKTFLVPRPFEGALTCAIFIAGIQVMLRKAIFLGGGSFLRSEATDLKSRTHQRTFVKNLSSLGAIPTVK